MSRVFISYSHQDRRWKDRVVEQLGALAREGLLSSWDDGLIQPGAAWLPELGEALASSRVAVLLVSAAFLNSEFITSRELPRLLERRRQEGMHVVPVIVSPCAWRALPWLAALEVRPLDGKTLAGLRKAEADKVLAALTDDILRLMPGGASAASSQPRQPAPGAGLQPRIAALAGPARAGRAPRSQVFESDQPLPNQEFAIELLTEPIILRRDGSALRVLINRDHVTEALFTTAAKRELCSEVLGSSGRLAAARRLDRKIHEFLLGGSRADQLVVHLDQLPLRWASGGVLSIVRWRGRLWTPFFFRDIPPFGWNIALGSSERGDNLNDPWTFLLREFLEETLVVDQEVQVGKEINFKPFVLDRLEVAREMARSRSFAAHHLQGRLHSDELTIRLRQEPQLDELDRRLCVVADFCTTGVEILVSHHSEARTTRNVLVAINPLELGIEVVKVLQYTLAEDDCILDGETLQRDGKAELVRMFVALISHDYLRAAFGRRSSAETPAAIQPSIEGPGIPAPHLRLYPFDLLRRREIALGNAPRSSSWERERYSGWLRQFGDLFFDQAGGVRTSHERALFTSTSAKILSYYFAGR